MIVIVFASNILETRAFCDSCGYDCLVRAHGSALFMQPRYDALLLNEWMHSPSTSAFGKIFPVECFVYSVFLGPMSFYAYVDLGIWPHYVLLIRLYSLVIVTRVHPDFVFRSLKCRALVLICLVS